MLKSRQSIRSPRKDARIFRKTADTTRRVNVSTTTPRGGFYF